MTLGKLRERIQRYNTSSKHALKAVLDDYFPELKSIFWSMDAKGLWAILENCPFPQDVLRTGVEELITLIAKSSSMVLNGGKIWGNAIDIHLNRSLKLSLKAYEEKLQ